MELLRFEAERIARGWSKAETARRASQNQTTVIEVLNGTRVVRSTAPVAQALARAFGWSQERAAEGLEQTND